LLNPNWGITSFDTIQDSALMVWQIITLEGWTYVMYSIEETSNFVSNIYFFIIVLVGSFFLVNLTLAVITIFFMQSQEESRSQQEAQKI
jgi:uncharacterized membrane protein